ncbi:hypothetical protein KGM48_03120 [Patescibacteria group bacterium]|nr:hypothetical protein [Patescibacteria group bacterium]
MTPLSAEDFGKGFPFQRDISEQIRFLLTAAVRAPSTHNCQPWRFRVENNRLLVYRDTRIRLPQSDPENRYAHISIGFLLHHIDLLGKWLSMAPQISLVNGDEHVAEITFSPATKAEEIPPLVVAIFKRRNRRGVFEDKPISQSIFDEATKMQMPSFIPPEVKVVTDRAALASIADATSGNMKRVYKRRVFRREMSSWITPNNSTRKDGIPGYSLNQPTFMSWILPTVIRLVNMGKVLAKLNNESIASAAAAFGFGAEDSPSGWLSVGFAASHTALTLVAHNIDYSVFVASIEYEDTRKSVGEVFRLHQPLEFLFVAGTFPDEVAWMTPRISIEDKLIPS